MQVFKNQTKKMYVAFVQIANIEHKNLKKAKRRRDVRREVYMYFQNGQMINPLLFHIINE
jgi:hypothetical protein